MIYLNYWKIYNLYVWALERGRKVSLCELFLPVLQQVQINYIFTDNVGMLCLSCNVKKSKTIVKFSEKSRNKSRSNRFLWCPLSRPCLYCFSFLPLLNMNQVPEKVYVGQWPYMAEKNFQSMQFQCSNRTSAWWTVDITT